MVACQPEFGAPGMSGRPSHSAGHAPTSRAVRPVSEFRVTIRPTRATRRAVLAADTSIVALGAARPLRATDRNSGVKGTSVSERVELGGRRSLNITINQIISFSITHHDYYINNLTQEPDTLEL